MRIFPLVGTGLGNDFGVAVTACVPLVQVSDKEAAILLRGGLRLPESHFYEVACASPASLPNGKGRLASAVAFPSGAAACGAWGVRDRASVHLNRQVHRKPSRVIGERRKVREDQARTSAGTAFASPLRQRHRDARRGRFVCCVKAVPKALLNAPSLEYMKPRQRA